MCVYVVLDTIISIVLLVDSITKRCYTSSTNQPRLAVDSDRTCWNQRLNYVRNLPFVVVLCGGERARVVVQSTLT